MTASPFLSNKEETPAQHHQCRKIFGGRFRPVCYISLTARLTVIPAVWWGVFGFGGPSGAQLLRDRLGLSLGTSAAVTAGLLGLLSAVTLLPCHVHRRWMRRCGDGACQGEHA